VRRLVGADQKEGMGNGWQGPLAMVGWAFLPRGVCWRCMGPCVLFPISWSWGGKPYLTRLALVTSQRVRAVSLIL
jgi:hypothetical protein